MSLDAQEVRLSKSGKVEITEGGEIYLTGFAGDNCSCRDVAVLALSLVIRQLQREMEELIRRPGGSGNVCVD